MKKTVSIICLIISCLTLSLFFTSCNKAKYNRNEKYLLGVCEKFYDYDNLMERCLSIDYVSDVVELFGMKTYRLPLSYATLFTVNSDNEPIFNEEKRQLVHRIIDSLIEHGIERICIITATHLLPYGYTATSHWTVPDPLNEQEYYIEFLKLYEKASRKVAQEFPQVRYFEPGNEPDHLSGRPISRNGYVLGGGADVNAYYVYSYEDIAHILNDICWYVNRGIKSVNPRNTVVLPGLCNTINSMDFLEEVYLAIESCTLPSGQEYADINPDNYFQILCWHPYLTGDGILEMGEEWLKFQKDMYAIAQRHGDDGKLVWYTEIGFTDRGFEDVEKKNADRLIMALNYIKNDLPFVETACIYRITDLVTAPVSDAENHFGIFRSLDHPDPARAGEPKPIAIALYKYFKGKDADITPLYKFMKTE